VLHVKLAHFVLRRGEGNDRSGSDFVVEDTGAGGAAGVFPWGRGSSLASSFVYPLQTWFRSAVATPPSPFYETVMPNHAVIMRYEFISNDDRGSLFCLSPWATQKVENHGTGGLVGISWGIQGSRSARERERRHTRIARAITTSNGLDSTTLQKGEKRHNRQRQLQKHYIYIYIKTTMISVLQQKQQPRKKQLKKQCKKSKQPLDF